jgi:carboxymethylenebutenolidase
MHGVPIEIAGERVEVHVDDGSPMGAYLARPVTRAAYPGVVVAMQMFGVSAHIRDVTDRVARLGYVAIAPDFYHRVAPGIELAHEERQRGLELIGQLSRAGAVADVSAAMGRLRAEGAERIGMLGFSLGGHIAYLAATQLDLAATAVFYGGWLTTDAIGLSRPDPTVALTAGIGGRMLLLTGGEDHLLSAEDREQLAAALEAAGVRHEIVVYPDAPHGFFSDARASFRPEARDDAWRRVRDLFAAEL